MIEQGAIHAVYSTVLGSRLAADAASAAMSLVVDDISDFNEAGGTLSINGAQHTYTSANFDTNTLTLTSGLAGAAAAVTPVDVWPLTPQKTALVMVTGADDALSVRVPHSLMDRLVEGIRDEDARESVQYAEQAGELVITDIVGKEPVIDGSYIDPATLPAAGTDGVAPASSPTPRLLSGVRGFIARWDPVVNADPVTYDLHVSTSSALGTTYGPATLLKSDGATIASVTALPGSLVPDLQYDTTYYALVVARDDDGAAAPSAVASVQLTRITGPDIAANTITGDAIVAGSITGAEFAGEVFIGNTFKTATTGRRTEWGIGGIQQYGSADNLTLNFPNDGTENLVDAEIIARGITVKEGGSFEGSSELRSGGTLTLTAGATAPSATPQLATYYDTVRPEFPLRAGPLGTFTLVPSEVSFIEWDAATSRIRIYQVRANGTRRWSVSTAGAVDAYVAGDDDTLNKVWARVVVPPGDVNAGTYRLVEGSSASDWWLFTPHGNYTWSPTYPSRRPSLVADAYMMYTVETIANGSAKVVARPTGVGPIAPNGSPVVTSYALTSATGLFTTAIASALWGSFDFGVSRWVLAERGNGSTVKTFTDSALTTLTVNPDKTFESPVVSRMGVCWDGTQFWTLGSDGVLYKHTNNIWDPATLSSTYWAKTSYRDSNAAGTGVHETPLGPVKSITAPRRGQITVTMPPLPSGGGGVDDPDSGRLYMARGATQPADASLKLQYSGAAVSYTFTTLQTATASHAVVPFPTALPSKINNPGDTLVISADGSINGVSVKQGGVALLTADAPYSYARYNAAVSMASSGTTYATLTGWTVETNVGVSHAAGVFTVPKAGRYQIDVNISYSAHATGFRGLRLLQGATAKQTVLIPASPTLHTTVTCTRKLVCTAGQTLTIQGIQNSGASLTVNGDADGFYTNLAIEYLGP